MTTTDQCVAITSDCVVARRPRDLDALRRHYDIEVELANRLRSATTTERESLYTVLYNELFRRVPDHPQNIRKKDSRDQQRVTNRQLKFLKHFLHREAVYVEIGAGDCHLAMQVARSVKQVYAIDVSDFMAAAPLSLENFSFVISDGTSIEVPAESATLAYSHQLMEHLHPEDAVKQLEEIHRALTSGGEYVCITPHRFSGPQDISQYFEVEAKGFHLREYTYGELRKLFRAAGFSSTSAWVGIRGRYFKMPEMLFRGFEALLAPWPKRLRRRWTRSILLRSFFTHIQIVGRK